MADPGSSLTAPERTKLVDLEGVIEKGITTFVEVGAALSLIRDQRLYRSTHDTFERYCSERWGWTRARAYQLIGASDVVAGLVAAGVEPPKTERAAREIGRQQREAAKPPAPEMSTTVDITLPGKAVSTRVDTPDPIPTLPDEPDPIAEWERAEEELAQARETIQALSADDTKAELAKMHEKYRALEGRLRQATTTLGECEKTAKYATGLLAKIRAKLNVERDREIMEALDAIMR